MTKMKTNSLDRSPLHLLHRVSQLAEEMLTVELGESDLTPRQVAVLVAVAENEGLSQAGIVERTGIDRSTLLGIVQRLQKKGWLQRRRTKKDARAYAVKLTDEGQSLLRKASPVVQNVNDRILAALPGRRGEQVIEQLAAIVTKLEA